MSKDVKSAAFLSPVCRAFGLPLPIYPLPTPSSILQGGCYHFTQKNLRASCAPHVGLGVSE